MSDRRNKLALVLLMDQCIDLAGQTRELLLQELAADTQSVELLRRLTQQIEHTRSSSQARHVERIPEVNMVGSVCPATSSQSGDELMQRFCNCSCPEAQAQRPTTKTEAKEQEDPYVHMPELVDDEDVVSSV